MSAVTTHVPDTARGVPAAGVQVWLEHVCPDGRTEIARTRTGHDGRAADQGPQRQSPGTYSPVFAPPRRWDKAHEEIHRVLPERFAIPHRLAPQQTLFETGRAVLEARDDVAEIRLPGEVFHAADRPYGLIQCAVQRDDAEDAGPAWDSAAAFEG